MTTSYLLLNLITVVFIIDLYFADYERISLKGCFRKMNKNIKAQIDRRWVLWLMTTMIVILMVGLSEIFQEKEFVFPEITALAVGAWLSPKRVWKVSKIRMILLIGIFASIGVILSAYVPIPQLLKIVIGFTICLIGLSLSRTTFAPLISATVLPVILHTTSWIYPISAICMTAIVAVGQEVLEKCGIKEKVVPSSVDLDISFDVKTGIKRLIVVALLAAISIYLRLPFLVAPPLLVAFLELTGKHPKLRAKSKQLLMLVLILTVVGAYGRLMLCEHLGLPLTLAALVSVCVMIFTMEYMKLYFPPAGALVILPLLIEADKLTAYPVAVTIGFCVLSLTATGISTMFKGQND